MPQGRIILKSICQSKKLSELKTDGARLLYTWLIPCLDIEGRFSGDEDVIKGQIFTRLKKTAAEIGKYLTDLARVGLIIWYEVDNDRYLQVPDFADRQPSLNPSKEADSTIPAPTPDQIQSSSCPTPPKVKESKIKVKESKSKYRDFVFLTDEEYEKLGEKWGLSVVDDKLDALNDYLGSTGKKYKSHYHTILSWDRRKSKVDGGNGLLSWKEKEQKENQESIERIARIAKSY